FPAALSRRLLVLWLFAVRAALAPRTAWLVLNRPGPPANRGSLCLVGVFDCGGSLGALRGGGGRSCGPLDLLGGRGGGSCGSLCLRGRGRGRPCGAFLVLAPDGRLLRSGYRVRTGGGRRGRLQGNEARLSRRPGATEEIGEGVSQFLHRRVAVGC